MRNPRAERPPQRSGPWRPWARLLAALGRRSVVHRFAAPAMLCDDAGRVHDANPGARAFMAAHGLDPTRLPPEAWPPIDGEDVAEVTLAQMGVRIGRHRLTGGRWLVLPQDAHDPAATARLFRSAHELLARVVATVAHDLRSPLASLFFNVGVLRNRWRELPPTQVDATLEAMARACELEMKTVAHLVERADAERQDAQPLGERLDRVVELLNPLFRGGANTLRVEIDRGALVPGASMLFDQIFVNLIGNAVESSPDPVAVEVVGSAIPPGGPMILEVRNDGPVIDAERRARIFHPFYTTKPTGTGMGLTFAREAARQLGGDVVLEQGPQTVFSVRLPTQAAEAS